MKLRQHGFSLVELMVTVAMMGILVTLAAMNYTELVRRVHFAEAKSSLSAIYTGEAAFFAEWSQYVSRLDVVNFQPNGAVYFNVGFDNDFAPPPDAPQGTPGCLTLCGPNVCPASFAQWRCTTESSNLLDGAGDALVAGATFEACAHSHFSTDPRDWITFTINQNKELLERVPAN